MTDDRHPIETALPFAVALWRMELDTLDPEERMQRAGEKCGDLALLIATKGDVLIYGGKLGEAAEVFNRLAEGVAYLSYCPGGITIFGQHYGAEKC